MAPLKPMRWLILLALVPIPAAQLSCPAGFMPDAQQTSCIPCLPGAYASAEGLTECTLCQRGTYAPLLASTNCTECEAGKYSTITGGNTSSTCTPCTACAQGQYTFRTCSRWEDSTCMPCTQCGIGYYLSNQVCATGTITTLGQNNLCLPCQNCPAGKFLSRNCDGKTNLVECVNCTVCASGAPLRPCTALSDTVCSNMLQCRSSFNYTRPDWLPRSLQTCRTGFYATSIYPTLSCARCPSHTIGDGLICRPCTGFKYPALSSTTCVCQGLTVSTDDGDCECPKGHQFADALCQPCPRDTYKNQTTHLPDDWWTVYSTCIPCPAGYTSPPGSTSCAPCPAGQYRQAGEQGCKSCSAPGYYARDPTSNTSCVQCNTSCPPGQSQDPCPNNPSLFACSDCPKPPANSSYYANCWYTCDPGFYKSPINYTCLPCNTSSCEPGRNRTQCTAYADSNCDIPCVNPEKPQWYSHYTQGCRWACNQNYTLTTHDYLIFTIQQCVPAKPVDLWASLFKS